MQLEASDTNLPFPSFRLLIRSYTVESCSALASCHVLVEQSEEQRNMHVGVVHVDDFESLPASDDLHSGQDSFHFGPFSVLCSAQIGTIHK